MSYHGTILHVDLDEILYLVSYRGEHKEFDDIVIDLKAEIHRRVSLLEHTEVKYYLSCNRHMNFRRRVLPTYKAHRDKRKPPLHLVDLREWADLFLSPSVHRRLEADDLIGLAITQQDGRRHIAVTQDKDIRSVPGWSFNPNKDKEPVFTSNEEARYNLLIQVLTGDTADGYKGIPGVGPAKAKKILKNNVTIDAVLGAYLDAGLTKEDLKRQYIVAKILRRQP